MPVPDSAESLLGVREVCTSYQGKDEPGPWPMATRVHTRRPIGVASEHRSALVLRIGQGRRPQHRPVAHHQSTRYLYL